MKLGQYHISTLFLLLAMAFVVIALVLDNLAFLGAVGICLIFGVKKDNNLNKA